MFKEVVVASYDLDRNVHEKLSTLMIRFSAPSFHSSRQESKAKGAQSNKQVCVEAEK